MKKILKKIVYLDKFRIFSLLVVVLIISYIFIQQTVLSKTSQPVVGLHNKALKIVDKKEKMIELRTMPKLLQKTKKENNSKPKKNISKANKKKQIKANKKTKITKKSKAKLSKKSKYKKVKIASKNVQYRGKSILANENVPQLEGKLNLPFKVYLTLMEAVGAKLVIYDMGSNRIKAHLSKGYVYSQFELSGFAARSRDVTNDIPKSLRNFYLTKINDKFGWGSYRFLLMLPRKLEEQFFGTIGLGLKTSGIDINKSDLVKFTYKGNKNHLTITIDEVQVQGKRSILNHTIAFLR